MKKGTGGQKSKGVKHLYTLSPENMWNAAYHGIPFSELSTKAGMPIARSTAYRQQGKFLRGLSKKGIISSAKRPFSAENNARVRQYLKNHKEVATPPAVRNAHLNAPKKRSKGGRMPRHLIDLARLSPANMWNAAYHGMRIEDLAKKAGTPIGSATAYRQKRKFLQNLEAAGVLSSAKPPFSAENNARVRQHLKNRAEALNAGLIAPAEASHWGGIGGQKSKNVKHLSTLSPANMWNAAYYGIPFSELVTKAGMPIARSTAYRQQVKFLRGLYKNGIISSAEQPFSAEDNARVRQHLGI